MDQSWFPVIVSIVVAAIGLAGNGALVAFFLGRMKGEMKGQADLMEAHKDFTQKVVDSLLSRMASADQFFSSSRADGAELRARIEAAEHGVSGVNSLEKEVVRLGTRFDAHHDQQITDMSVIKTSLEGLQRQMGYLATHGPGKPLEMRND